MNWKLEQIY